MGSKSRGEGIYVHAGLIHFCCAVDAKIMASGPITSWEIDGETVETASDFIFGAPKSLQMVIAAMKLKDAYSLEGKLWSA